MSEKNVPNVRFEGFSESWEQRKFKKLYRKNTEKNEYQFTSDKTISIATMAYKTEGNGASDKSVPGYKVLRVGDIAFEGHKSKEFSFGRFVLNDIGDGIMSPRFTALRPLKNTNIQFWKYYIHYEPIMKKVLVRSTKLGTMMNELVLDDLFKQNLLVPSNLEQEKIGALLKKIDLIIASNQHKLDQLKEVKKLLMQKIFDQEWRFEGFTDPWEQRQLGKIVDERKERSSQGELLSVTMHDGIKKSSTLGKKDNSSDNKSNYKVVCQGDIAYNSMRMWQGASGLSMFNGIVSPAYTVLKIGTSIDGSFLSYLFKRSEMIWMFRTHSQGLTSDTWNLKYPALSKIKIEYPILNEQIRISTFLKNFDQLIASNQQKLDQLKELKKWFMQNMFV